MHDCPWRSPLPGDLPLRETRQARPTLHVQREDLSRRWCMQQPATSPLSLPACPSGRARTLNRRAEAPGRRLSGLLQLKPRTQQVLCNGRHLPGPLGGLAALPALEWARPERRTPHWRSKAKPGWESNSARQRSARMVHCKRASVGNWISECTCTCFKDQFQCQDPVGLCPSQAPYHRQNSICPASQSPGLT
jgi:hypothetical protein